MKTFTMGVIAGASTLALAVPLLAQVSSAASSTGTTGQLALKTRPIPSQACVQAIADQEGAMLSKIDAMAAAHKIILQTHHTALVAAAGIADDTQREAAIKAANTAMRDAMKAQMNTADRTAAEAALKTACGNNMPFGGIGGGMEFGMMDSMDSPRGGGHRGGMHGPGAAQLAQKLGMTEAELKAAIDGGKTIEQIATEKGITLPKRPKHGMGMMRGLDKDQDDAATTTTTQQ